MQLEERESEIILEKLERMEDFLKSFIASLGEESKRLEIKFVPIYSRAEGTIHKWNFRTGNRVGRNDKVCFINPDEERNPNPKLWELIPVLSPAMGMLSINTFYKDKGSTVRSSRGILGHIEPRENY
ncbi:MAG: hypothetical protein NOU37_02900 [Candidatus Brocadiales bacterium]|nr:hypothetical protein [Candidatus Bathyanammoxibius amoris]